MPDPPRVDLFTRFVLENPYPLAAVLAVLALGLAWMGLREQRVRHLQIAGGVAVLAAIVLLTGLIVTTSAEHGKAVTRQLVHHAVNAEAAQAMSLFSHDAALSVGSPRNPGVGIDVIRRQIERLDGHYRIRSNRITSMKAYSESRDAARVDMTCWTEVEGGGGPTPSQWILRIERQPDGEWLITRITAVSIARQTPTHSLW
jgi:hypothetical protein